MADDTVSPAIIDSAEPTPSNKAVRYGLLPAIILTFLWLGILAVLSLWTANPVTLNRVQIFRSQYILTGQIADPQTGSIKIETLIRVDNQPIDQKLLSQTIRLQPIGKHWQAETVRIFPVFRDATGNWKKTFWIKSTPFLDSSLTDTNYRGPLGSEN